MKKLRYIINTEQSAYMRQRKTECLARSLKNRAENWAADRLKVTGKKWKRQAVWVVCPRTFYTDLNVLWLLAT